MAESFIAANFMMNSESEDDRLHIPFNIPAQTQFNGSQTYGVSIGTVPGHATFTIEWDAMNANIRCVGGMGSQFTLTATSQFYIGSSLYTGDLIGSTIFNGYTVMNFAIPAKQWTFTTEDYQESEGHFNINFSGSPGQFLFDSALSGEIIISWV